MFQLIITVELMQTLCDFTNKYASAHIGNTAAMAEGWYDVTVVELYKYIALLFYMAIVELPNQELYWSTKPLFHGIWARAFMSKNRFKQIGCFLKISNFETEDKDDKLTKVRFLHDYVRRKSMKLYQPKQNISIDERMVRNKGRYSFRQYIKDKPTKWGMKIWVLAESATGYTYDYEVYTGKSSLKSVNGLGYDVVMKLCKSFYEQGYRLFIDNFYTSGFLLSSLLSRKVLSCGTIKPNRRGFPTCLKNVKKFKGQRGEIKWVREGNVGYLQWVDNKLVSFASTMHTDLPRKSSTQCKRRTKVNGIFRHIIVRQPQLVHDYNCNMGGVDKSDQLIGKYKTLRPTVKYWKTLFYHFLDIARVNSYIMMQDWRAKNPDIPELQRLGRYNQLQFTIELIRQLAGVNDDAPVPLYSVPKSIPSHVISPAFSEKQFNCKRCYRRYHKEVKTKVYCTNCNVHLCFTAKRNCLSDEH